MKRILALLLALLTLVCSIPIAAYAEEKEMSYVWKDLSQTPIQADLADVDLTKYVKDSDIRNVSIIALAEQGFSTLLDYNACKLYIYVYNPTTKDVKPYGLNYIQFKDATEKIKLKYISHTNTIIKFQADLTADFFEQLDTKKREYNITSVELQFTDNTIKDYAIGGTYTFTGYDENVTLSSVETFEYVTLDINYTTFRNTSDLGEYYRNQLTSVYFSIPNYLIKKYNGKFYGIDCTYEKYYTKPIVVTNNQDVYNVLDSLDMSSLDLHLNSALDDTILEGKYRYSSDVPLSMYAGIISQTSVGGFNGLTKHSHIFNWSFNWDMSNANVETVSNLYEYSFTDNYTHSSYLPIYVYQSGDFDSNYWVNQEVMQEKINSFYSTGLGNDSFYKKADLDYYHSLLFENYIFEIDGTKTEVSKDNCKISRPITVDDEPYDMISYDENHNWWDYLMDFGFKQWFTGLPNDVTYKDIPPISPIKSTDYKGLSSADFATKYYVGEKEVSDVISRTMAAELNDETMYIFRLDVAPYYSIPVTATLNEWNVGAGQVFMCQEPVYMGFDVLNLLFKDEEGEIVKVSVSSTPENLVGGVEPDLPDIVDEDFENWKEDLINKIKEAMLRFLRIFGIICVIILVVVLIPYAIKFIQAFIDGLSGLIQGTSNGVQKMSNKAQKRVKRNRRNRK